MSEKTTYIDQPEAVGVFDSFETLQQAIYDLMMVGFSRADISLLGSEAALTEKLGRSYWRAQELEDDPRAAFVSEEAIGELEGGIAGGGDRHAAGPPRRPGPQGLLPLADRAWRHPALGPDGGQGEGRARR